MSKTFKGKGFEVLVTNDGKTGLNIYTINIEGIATPILFRTERVHTAESFSALLPELIKLHRIPLNPVWDMKLSSN
jgi:hypothetical protein